MKKPLYLLSGLILLLLIPGCTSVKRYKSATYKSQDNSLVDMELFGTRLIPEGSSAQGRNLWNLSASAQTQLIQILNERYSDNGQFIRSLSNVYLGENAFATHSFTRKDLRMVFTISTIRDFKALNDASARFSPADRIEYLQFSLEIPEEYNLRFIDWNRYTTEYGEIEIADVSFNRNLELTAEASQANMGDVEVKRGISRREEQAVRTRYLKLNGSISDRTIKIEEEGNREIDLEGNVIADVSLEFAGFPERITIPLFSGSGSSDGKPREVAALNFVDVLVPRMEEAPDTIRATLVMDYIYRHVQTGWKTYQEWDDRVEYYSGTVKKEVPLFTSSDYLPAFYCIGIDDPEKHILKIKTGGGETFPLQFKDYTDASRFYQWLISRAVVDDLPGGGYPVRIGNTTLLFRENSLTYFQLDNATNLKVMPVY